MRNGDRRNAPLSSKGFTTSGSIVSTPDEAISIRVFEGGVWLSEGRPGSVEIEAFSIEVSTFSAMLWTLGVDSAVGGVESSEGRGMEHIFRVEV